MYMCSDCTRPLSPGIRNKPEEYGVIPNSFGHIFTHISRTHDEQYLIRASYLEIYQVRLYRAVMEDGSTS